MSNILKWSLSRCGSVELTIYDDDNEELYSLPTELDEDSINEGLDALESMFVFTHEEDSGECTPAEHIWLRMEDELHQRSF